MKTLFTRKTVTIAAIAVIIAIITLVSVNVFDNGGPVTGLANAVSRPLKTWASAIARRFEGIYGSIYRYEALKADYEQAIEKIKKLEETSREATHLEEELIYLRALHDFGERNSGHVYELAQIESPGASNWSSSFTINKGSENSNISKGNCVITEYGILIGKIVDVGATSSTFISVLDTTFSAGVLIGEGGGSAAASGDFSLMNLGLLKLDHIAGDQPVLPGDTIVTSGISGTFPAGLIIGEVADVFNHDTGIGQYAIIKPFLTLETISVVAVITEFETADTE